MESQKKTTKYNCADIEKKVHAYIDDKLSEAEKILFEEHLDYCLPCDKKIEFEKKLKEFVKLKVREELYPKKLNEELKNIMNKNDD